VKPYASGAMLRLLYSSCLDLLHGRPRSRSRDVANARPEESDIIARTARTHPGDGTVALGGEALGFRGRIAAIVAGRGGGLPPDELERRLIELGLVEGARVEILHEGLFSRDPIALRVDTTTVALRRQEASAILVRPE
jgi:ferrous iron transport protein A